MSSITRQTPCIFLGQDSCIEWRHFIQHYRSRACFFIVNSDKTSGISSHPPGAVQKGEMRVSYKEVSLIASPLNSKGRYFSSQCQGFCPLSFTSYVIYKRIPLSSLVLIPNVQPLPSCALSVTVVLLQRWATCAGCRRAPAQRQTMGPLGSRGYLM